MAVTSDYIETKTTLKKRSRMGEAILDLWRGLKRYPLWLAFAWEDIKSTYRRSLFGALWISLSFAAFMGVKIIIFGPLMPDIDQDYFGAYLLCGFFIFQFMTQGITSAPTVFVSSEGWIKNDPLPYSVYVFQAATKHLFNLIFSFLVVVFFYWYFSQPITIYMLLSALAILILILNTIWIKLFLGIIGTRFRDIIHLTQTVMRFMFFLTPIFWFPEQMGGLMKYLWWNPLAHFIWIFRKPLLDQDPAIESWIFVGVITVVGWIIALITFALYRRRIPFWF